MSDGAQYVILCEDRQSQTFIRRALVASGANGRRIRLVPLPSDVGGGAGHGYVLEKYPSEVTEFRKRNAKASSGLVVHIDADPTHTVAARHAQLAATLQAKLIAPRGRDEPIAELVPKRNIETWIHALDPTLDPSLARPLNEADAYPKLEYERACATAAERFADHARTKTSPSAASAVPSLLDGLAEFRRLP